MGLRDRVPVGPGGWSHPGLPFWQLQMICIWLLLLHQQLTRPNDNHSITRDGQKQDNWKQPKYREIQKWFKISRCIYIRGEQPMASSSLL